MTVVLPPPQFDHAYRDGKLTVSIMDVRKVQEACHGEELTGPGASEGSKGVANSSIYACTILLKEAKVCWVVLPKVEAGIVTQAQQDRLRRHELGHCNGWLADHAGAVNNYHLICEGGP
jgi:hypothetical protein